MVSLVFPDFLYWTTLKNIKAIDVIKKYIGSILPSKPAIIFYFYTIDIKNHLLYY